MHSESSTTDPTIEVIREKLRNTTLLERKQQRVTNLNKNRVALGEIKEINSFTPEFVTEKAKVLKKKKLSVNDYTELQNALIQSEENVNAFLKVDNILFALARDLSSYNPTAQLGAANCCCNIALGNAKTCAALAKNIAPHIVTKLESLNRPLLEVCVWTIGNLATGSEKAFDILYAQDCMKYLAILLRDCDDDILPSVTYAALHCIYAGHSKISDIEMTEFAQIVARRKISYDDCNLLWLFALLSSSAACSKYFYNILPSLIDYLHHVAKHENFPVDQLGHSSNTYIG